MGVSYFLYLSCLGLAITAQAQDCSRPVGNPNTVLTDNLETYPSGTKVTFECEIGYITAGGNPTITCIDGTWSPLRLKCERRNCGSAGEVENGQVDYPEGTEFGDKLVVRCNTGFEVVGRHEIICGIQGWMDRLPVCEVVTCPKLPTFVNGTFSPVRDVYKYQDVVQYKCLQGYTLNGSKSISCSENEKFEPSPPTCVKVDCPDPRIPNSEFVGGSRPPHGYKATVTFKCNNGYTMTGDGTLTCQINSQWSPGLPTCTIQDCTRPVGGPNTVLTDNRETYPSGTAVTFECETGYITDGGNPRITCTAGTWSPLSLKCKRIEITTKPTPRTTSSTTTTKRPYPITTKKPNDNNNANHVVRNTLIVLGVLAVIAAISTCVIIKLKRKKKGTGNHNLDKEAPKHGENLALA